MLFAGLRAVRCSGKEGQKEITPRDKVQSVARARVLHEGTGARRPGFSRKYHQNRIINRSENRKAREHNLDIFACSLTLVAKCTEVKIRLHSFNN